MRVALLLALLLSAWMVAQCADSSEKATRPGKQQISKTV